MISTSVFKSAPFAAIDCVGLIGIAPDGTARFMNRSGNTAAEDDCELDLDSVGNADVRESSSVVSQPGAHDGTMWPTRDSEEMQAEGGLIADADSTDACVASPLRQIPQGCAIAVNSQGIGTLVPITKDL